MKKKLITIIGKMPISVKTASEIALASLGWGFTSWGVQKDNNK